MQRLKKILPTIFIVLLFIVGVGVLAYPTVSDWWNNRVQSRAVASYNEAVSGLNEQDYSLYFAAAEAYNEELRKIGVQRALQDPEELPGYEDILNVTGTGIMGTITIDKINVNLPIYHGTSESVLSAGAGHLEGTSFPIGGKGNHSVISAHRGLPSSKLFTNLDQLDIGDIFSIHVLNETLNYEVDQIVTVLPTELEDLYLKEGEDYCTLMTCTPYGINTHRMLVRGHRVYLTPEEIAEIADETAAQTAWPVRRIIQVGVMIIGAIILVLLLSQIFVMVFRKKN